MKQPKLKEIIKRLEKEDYAKWEPLKTERCGAGIFERDVGGYVLETDDLIFYIRYSMSTPGSLPYSPIGSLKKEFKILERSVFYELEVHNKSGSAEFNYVDKFSPLKEFYEKVYNYVEGPRLVEKREKRFAEEQELAKKELENAQKQKDFERAVSDFLSQ